MKKTILMLAIFFAFVAASGMPAACAASDEVNAFAALIKEIQLDKPLPNVGYLQSVKPLNKGELRYIGSYQNWRIHVTVKESTGLIKDFGISREGGDIIDNLLSLVATVYGDNYQAREKSPRDRGYGWDLGDFKMLNLFYQSGVVRCGGGYL